MPRSSSSLRSSSRVDDDEARLVELEMPLDQRQRAFADRAEADHHDRAVDAGMERAAGHGRALQNGCVLPPNDDGIRSTPRAATDLETPPRHCNAGVVTAELAAWARQRRGAAAARGWPRGPARGTIAPRRRRARPARSSQAEQAARCRRGRAATARRSARPRSRSGRSRPHRRASSTAPWPRAGRGRAAHAASARRRCRGSGVPDRPRAARAAAPAIGPGADVPQPHGADEAAVCDRDEGEAFGGRAAVAQPLGGSRTAARQSRHRAAPRARRRRQSLARIANGAASASGQRGSSAKQSWHVGPHCRRRSAAAALRRSKLSGGSRRSRLPTGRGL